MSECRALTLLGGAPVQTSIMGPHFFWYLIFNGATFLNTVIIDDSGL